MYNCHEHTHTAQHYCGKLRVTACGANNSCLVKHLQHIMYNGPVINPDINTYSKCNYTVLTLFVSHKKKKNEQPDVHFVATIHSLVLFSHILSLVLNCIAVPWHILYS